ncbi:MAG: hypothetical protein WC734_04605 [Patescibacteria group bacterium]|jgi:hypothetical protein
MKRFLDRGSTSFAAATITNSQVCRVTKKKVEAEDNVIAASTS